MSVNDMSEKDNAIFAELAFVWIECYSNCLYQAKSSSEVIIVFLLIASMYKNVIHVADGSYLST